MAKIKHKPSKTRAVPRSLKPLALVVRVRIEEALEDETLDALRARAGVDAKTLSKALAGLPISGQTRRKLEAAFPAARGGE